jgi:hypothetical protein
MAYLPKAEGTATIADLLFALTDSTTQYRGVADAIGVHERTLYKWLSGQTRVPKSAVLALYFLAIERAVSRGAITITVKGHERLTQEEIDSILGFDAL